jgi:uncharacterized protein (DUF305 family)
MKLTSHSIKLVLAGGLTTALLGCSGGPGTSTAGATPPSHAASTHSGQHDMAMGTQGMTTLQKLSDRDFDVAFMSQMITHHQGAVDMAEQTLKVAQRPETKQEAQKIIDSQTGEIAQMQGWLKEWYDTAPSKEQQDLMQKDMAAMMGMPITDDAMFFAMMIPHHQGAVEMSQLAVDKSPRQELRELAAKMKQDQTEEIQKYQELAKP